MIKLDILTDNKELASICKLYWEVDSNLKFVHKVSVLAELSRIDKAKLPSVIKEACNAYVSDWNCASCEKSFLFSKRNDFTKKRPYLLNGSYRQQSFLCSECEKKRRDREIEERKQQEEVTRKAREAIKIELRQKISEVYSLSHRKPLDTASLSLTDIIYLISILRGACENLTKIMPVSMFEQPLTADSDFSTEIIEQLHQNELIYVHPDTEPEAFVNDEITRFYIYHVYYAPSISQLTPDDPKRLVTELHKLVNDEWSEEWCQEALELWRKVALSECKEYLYFVLNEHHFEFSAGEKTTQYLDFVLQNFSTAQVFNTIWRAAEKAAAYYQREKISKRQAANTAVTYIQKYSERVIAENWEIKPYKRNYKCPQAIISEVLYNFALKLGEAGFETIPNIETIRAKKLKSANIKTEYC